MDTKIFILTVGFHRLRISGGLWKTHQRQEGKGKSIIQMSGEEQKMEWVMVELNGTQKRILREKLPETEKMVKEIYDLAIKTGYPEEYAKEHFTLRIVKDES
ncbi:MAG TPA: hypothetical protein DDY81_02150 [Clostridiales bacterium]|nr:hypothetical protein [Clostridiales bacterium]